MIYIIGGASRSGKSILAKRMASKLGVPFISTDYLMMGFMNGMPTVGIHDKLWPNEIAVIMWPFLSAMIENIIYSQQDYIIEGEAMLPESVKGLLLKHPEHIKACFIGYDAVKLDEKMNDVVHHPNHSCDWLISQSKDEIANHISNMMGYSLKLKQWSSDQDIEYFSMGKSFEDDLERAMSYLLSS